MRKRGYSTAKLAQSRRLPSSSSQSLRSRSFDVGGGPARVEGVELALLRLGQAVAELEVVGPLRQRVVGRHRRGARHREPLAVFLAQRLAGVDDRAVAGGGGGAQGIARLTASSASAPLRLQSRDSARPYTAPSFLVRFNNIVPVLRSRRRRDRYPEPPRRVAQDPARQAPAVRAVGRLRGRGRTGRAFDASHHSAGARDPGPLRLHTIRI